MTLAEIAVIAAKILAAYALSAAGVLCIWLAVRLRRARPIEPTGQALVFRNGRFEARSRVTMHDVHRAMGNDR